MSQLHVEVSADIPAPPDKVYGVIADYHTGHPAILPQAYFTGLDVDAGGRGAGTRLRVHMNVFGTKVTYNQIVTEPQPGRVLTESDEAQGVTTTFTVDPLDGGTACRVTIATDSRLSPGFKGLVEKLLNPGIMRRIYREELQNLSDYVSKS